MLCRTAQSLVHAVEGLTYLAAFHPHSSGRISASTYSRMFLCHQYANLKRRIQELEEETAALKQQLRQTSGPLTFHSVDESRALASDSVLPYSPSIRSDAGGTGVPFEALSNEALVHRRHNVRSHDPTVSRSIDGIELEPSMIDECFSL
jgi:hypothetical protein